MSAQQSVFRNAVTISAADFGTGLLAALAARSVTDLPESRMDAPIVRAFESWSVLAEEAAMRLRFFICLDETHRDSPGLRDSIGGALARGLGHPGEGARIVIDLTPREAMRYFEHLPGPRELWVSLGRLAVEELSKDFYVNDRPLPALEQAHD